MNNRNRHGEVSDDAAYNYLMNAFDSLTKTTTKIIKNGQSSMIIEVLNDDLAKTQTRRGRQRNIRRTPDRKYSQTNASQGYDATGGRQQSCMTQQQNIQQTQGNQRQQQRSRIVEQHPGIVQQLVQKSRTIQHGQSSTSNIQNIHITRTFSNQPTSNTFQNVSTNNFQNSYNVNVDQGQMHRLQTTENTNLSTVGGNQMCNHQTTSYALTFDQSMPSAPQQTNLSQYQEGDRRCFTPQPTLTMNSQNLISLSSLRQRMSRRPGIQGNLEASGPELNRRCMTPHPSMLSANQQPFFKLGPAGNRKRKIEQISREILLQNSTQNPFVSISNNFAQAQNFSHQSRISSAIPTFDNRQQLQDWSSNRAQNESNIDYTRRADTPHPGLDNFSGWTNNTLTTTPLYRQSCRYNTLHYQNTNTSNNTRQWNNSSVEENTQTVTSLTDRLSNNCDYWNPNIQSMEVDSRGTNINNGTSTQLVNQNYTFKFSGVKNYATNNSGTGSQFNSFQSAYQNTISPVPQRTVATYRNVSGSATQVQQNYLNNVNFIANQTSFNVPPPSIASSSINSAVSTNDQEMIQDNQISSGSAYSLRTYNSTISQQSRGPLASFDQIRKK